MILIDKIIKLLPAHMQKINNIKFITCIFPLLKYLDDILEDDRGMSNLDKAHGEYLDYFGYRWCVPRLDMTDDEYRAFLKMFRYRMTNVPTTNNVMLFVQGVTGYLPTESIKNPDGEPASHYLKFIVPHTEDKNKFPDLNELIDAGARMYYDIVFKAHRVRKRSSFISGTTQLNPFYQEIEIKK